MWRRGLTFYPPRPSATSTTKSRDCIEVQHVIEGIDDLRGQAFAPGGSALKIGDDEHHVALSGHAGRPLAINPGGLFTGVGLTSPRHTLHVRGELRVDTAASLPALLIDSGGAVALGRDTTSSEFRLSVIGRVNADAFVENSDLALKTDVTDLRGGLAGLLKLRGVRYRRKDAPDVSLAEIGLVAQEVEREFPEVVRRDGDGRLSVAYTRLVAVLVEAVKELKQECDELRSRVDQRESP